MESLLFDGFTSDEIKKYTEETGATVKNFRKGEAVFTEGEEPRDLFVLLSGAVQVEKIEKNGKRHIVNRFYKPGTVFGEVYLYLHDHPYDYSCVAFKESEVMEIPREGMTGNENERSRRITDNMLSILAGKAFYLNQKLLLHSSFTLRQKIARYLLRESKGRTYFTLPMTREEMADFIGTTRPSLSRELMEMQKDGYLEIDREEIKINGEKLEDLT